MRMWMVDPEIMCQKHLCGEHVELHMFLSHLKLRRKIQGYIKNNCLEPASIWKRHSAIATEMLRRDYKHKSPMLIGECLCVIDLPNDQYLFTIDKKASLEELLKRCPKCRERYLQKKMEGWSSMV